MINTEDQLRVAVLENAVADEPDGEESASAAIAGDLEAPLRTLQIDIGFSDSERVSARGTEDTLQLVASWVEGREGCKVEVDSITALEDGTTRGQRWIERVVRPGEWFELTPHLE